jgi:Protein of unknown function (DUF559)
VNGVVLLPRVLAPGGTPISWEAWVLAGCLRAAPGAAAAGSTAARVWGLIEDTSHEARSASGSRRGSHADQRPIEIATTRNMRDDSQTPVDDRYPLSSPRPEFRFHRVARLPPDQVSVVRAIPVTSTERTLLDVAGSRAPWVLNEALDCALRADLTSLERLNKFLDGERRSGVHGVLRLRSAVEARSAEIGTTRSVLEREFLSVLVDAGLSLPLLNQEVRGPNGFCALVDMLFPENKLIVEIQSYEHHSSLEAFNRDAARLTTLTVLGYRVIEMTAEQIRRRPHQTIQLLSDLLQPIRTRSLSASS